MIGAMSNMINNAIEIIKNCEDVQDSNESRYTKEEAERTAHKELRDLIMEAKNEDRV